MQRNLDRPKTILRTREVKTPSLDEQKFRIRLQQGSETSGVIAWLFFCQLCALNINPISSLQNILLSMLNVRPACLTKMITSLNISKFWPRVSVTSKRSFRYIRTRLQESKDNHQQVITERNNMNTNSQQSSWNSGSCLILQGVIKNCLAKHKFQVTMNLAFEMQLKVRPMSSQLISFFLSKVLKLIRERTLPVSSLRSSVTTVWLRLSITPSAETNVSG